MIRPKLHSFLHEFFIHLITFLNTALYTSNRVLTAVTYFARMKIMLILASSTAIVSRHDNALIHAPVIHNSVPISMSQNWLFRRTTRNVFPIRILSRYFARTKSQLSVSVLILKFRTVMSLFSNNSQRNIRHRNQLPQPLSTIYLQHWHVTVPPACHFLRSALRAYNRKHTRWRKRYVQCCQ
jgi:hypothetical protein